MVYQQTQIQKTGQYFSWKNTFQMLYQFILCDKNNWVACQCVSSCDFDAATVGVLQSRPSIRSVCAEPHWLCVSETGRRETHLHLSPRVVESVHAVQW